MRVIAGIRKGLKLNAPDGMDTRPTTDRVKESVFNILQPYVPRDRVLDLFAGSGGLGIEALSRRCSHCTFVEHNRAAFSVVRQNIKASGFEDCSSLVFSDSMAYLDGCAEPFDIIFLDPPYNKGFLYPVLDKIIKKGLLNEDGIIVAETEKDGEEAEHPELSVVRRAKYGKTIITVLRRGEIE